jgi:hypothetical protein
MRSSRLRRDTTSLQSWDARVQAAQLLTRQLAPSSQRVHNLVGTTMRVMAAAGGGEVLLTTAAYEAATGSGLRFSAAGEHSLKGLPEPRRLYRVEHREDSRVRDT